MSNDNKTLADVQPGGRVRLGDQPTIEKRARELLASAYADTGAPALLVDEVRGGKHDTASDNAALRAIVTALSAQPSPGGQDVLAALQQDYDKLLDSFNRQVEVAEKIAGRALQQDDRIEELEEALAARQPVGQEPFAYGSSAGHQPIPAHAYGEGCSDVYDIPLYAAQPAQAVDLGPSIPSELAPVAAALKRFNECAEDSDSDGCDIGRDWFDALTTIGLLKRTQRSPAVWTMTAEGERLLALVNGKAVGNGN